jgi:hypothetical protein
MAINLQSKLSSSDTLVVQDINTNATKRFVEQVKAANAGGAVVKVADTIGEATEDSVCHELVLYHQDLDTLSFT